MTAQQDAEASFLADLERTVDRLRGMALTRLGGPFEPEASRAQAAYDLAQRLADVAADLAGEPRRPLPRLADGAVGDQLAVVGHDLLEAAQANAGADVLETAARELLELRRRV